MDKILTLLLYILWIGAIIAVVAATFTDFKYPDLNLIALLFLIFAGINSFFSVSGKKRRY